MTVSREIVKLLYTRPEAWEYSINPPPEALGISVSWLQWLPLKPNETEKDQKVITEFITSDRYLVRTEQKTEKDIRLLLGTHFRNRLLDRGLSHQDSPTIALRIEAPLGHPLVAGPTASREIKRAAETAGDVHEVRYTRQQLAESTHPEMIAEGYKDAERGQRARQEMKHFAIAPKYSTREKVTRFLGQEKGYVEEQSEEEQLVYDFGIIEQG